MGETRNEHQDGSILFNCCRIPLELLEMLPESRIDPETEEGRKLPTSFKVRVGPIDHLVIEDRRTPPLPSPPTAWIDDFGCSSNDESLTESLTETVVCSETFEGTVFGLIQTPVLPRRTSYQASNVNETRDYQRTGIRHTNSGSTVVDIRKQNRINFEGNRVAVSNIDPYSSSGSSECYNLDVAFPVKRVTSVQQLRETVNPRLTESFRKVMLPEKEKTFALTGGKVTTRPPEHNKEIETKRLDARRNLLGPRLLMNHTNKRITDAQNAVIEELDKVLIEADESSMKVQHTLGLHHKVITFPAEVEPETDNLIEEVFLPGPNRRSYLSFPADNLPSLSSVHSNHQNDNYKSHAANGSFDGAVVPNSQGNDILPSLSDQEILYKNQFFVVVAIDFGTTYSGYAFSFVREPDKIHMMRKWEGGDPGVMNQKTPTTLLLTPEGNFHSFGFAARDYYHNLEPDESKKWLFFEKFKMTLHHSESLSRDTLIKATNGKELSAVNIFAHALRFFKEHALNELSDQSATPIINDDVRWVVTVPAIWRQPAKQFMRAAAYQAGIASAETSENLLIALEPEAASIYCRQLRLHQLIPDAPPSYNQVLDRRKNNFIQNHEPAVHNSKEHALLTPIPHPRTAVQNSLCQGTRYMVVDCGGGTVDITVHELLDETGSLKELTKATGGPHGSVGVDAEFQRLLSEIFGTEFMENFKSKRPVGFVDLMVAFEARKRNASPYNITPLNVTLPFSFIDFYKKQKGHSVESAIRKHGNKEVLWSSQGMLRLESSAMNNLFQPTIKHVKKCIQDVLSSSQVEGVSYLFLVGGFAESQILRKEIRDSFAPFLKVIIPQGVSLAILTGAVLFGLDPGVVYIRRSRLTYGVGVLNRFIHGVHPQEKLVVKDGIEWCADVFDIFVVSDQSVGLGEAVLRSYTPAKQGQTCTILHIYCSEAHDVDFITDEGVERCGTLVLDLSDDKNIATSTPRREIQTRMIFGDTEIKVSALDVTTGKLVKAEIDFLNQ